MKKYFINKVCNVIINGQNVVLANKFTGQWIKIPIECYQALKYGAENVISVYKLTEVFEDQEDKLYFTNLLKNLDLLGFLSEDEIKDMKINYVAKIIFSITNRCNLKCNYCCVDAESTTKEDIMTTNDIKEAIDKIIKLNPRRIVLSGGEPLLRKDFIEILEYISKVFNGKIILCTNATLITEFNVEYIAKYLYSIEISLDGVDEESCCKIRGKGVFDKVIKNIKLLQAKGFKNIALSMVLGKNSDNYVERFNELNDSLGTKSVFRKFTKIGRGSINFNGYTGNHNIVQYTKENEYEGINNKIIANHCNAGNTQLFVNYNGNVFLCPLMQDEKFRLCHVSELEEIMIKEIFKRSNVAFSNFDKIKPQNIEECKNCKVNIFCMGCSATTHLLLNDKKAFNYTCQNVRKNLIKKVWG